jgi:long-chain acyl-CoA synthetase
MSFAELCKDKDLNKKILDDLVRLTTENKCSSLEKPKEIFLSSEPMSIENNILTPTFKLKRNIARDVYKAEIDAMYVELAKRGL